MIIRKFFRLLNDAPDAGGTGSADRGDLLELPEDEPLELELEAVKDEPAVKELEAELEAEKDDKPAKDSRIPAARHKEILEKERAKTAAVLAENVQLKQRAQREVSAADASVEFAALDAQIEALETEYANLLTDGEIKKAGETMKKIRATERYMSESKADMKIQASAATAQEAARFQAALSRVETAYPVLNPDSEAFDERTEARVARLNRANRAEGMSAVAALQDAVETILGAETPQQERATAAPKNVGAERKAAAVAKAVAATGKTPASLSRAGLDSDKLGGGEQDARAVMKMTQKEFAGLSDALLSKMRGDTLG